MSGTYTTKSGDMWDSISYELTGSHAYTEELQKANLQYADVYIFTAGIVLAVPDFDTILDYESLPPWKRE